MIASTPYRAFSKGEPFVIYGLEEDETVFRPIQKDMTWEPHLIAVLERIIQPEFLCLDIGANIGAITLPLARLASRGHVHAFEASSGAAALLARNLAENAIPNVSIVQKAVTEHTGGTVDLFTIPGQLGTAHQAIDIGRDGEKQTVETLALDDYFFPLEHVDFIKLDIEGGEIAALSGAGGLIEHSRPALAIEYNPAPAEWFAKTARDALYSVLTRLYPRIELIEADGNLRPITMWSELDRELSARGWCDLLCT